VTANSRSHSDGLLLLLHRVGRVSSHSGSAISVGSMSTDYVCAEAKPAMRDDESSSSGNKDRLGRSAVAAKQQRYTQLLNQALQDHGERGQIPVRQRAIGMAAFLSTKPLRCLASIVLHPCVCASPCCAIHV